MNSAEIVTARELATHAADIKHLQEDMDGLVADMMAIKRTLNTIERTLAEAKGGWRMLMMVGGAGGALGAALTQMLHSVPFVGSK
jgi:fructoselysine-6-P-deglycase FrlB-like protein